VGGDLETLLFDLKSWLKVILTAKSLDEYTNMLKSLLNLKRKLGL